MAVDLDRARRDVAYFAEKLVGEPLWDHQLEVVRSPARIRCLCSGRQAGKSRTLAVSALHEAFRGRRRRVLLVSAGEDAAKDLLAEISMLASAPLLAGSVVDDEKSLVTLSNGSWIRSVPASQRQVRGKAVDLLILDEACFVDEEVWNAARFTVIARPRSRVLMASTPYGRHDAFFAVHWRAGVNGLEDVASFHWPSTVSPLVDRDLLELWRATSTERQYRAEVLAEWVDEAGGYFTAAELSAAVREYPVMVPPRGAPMVVSAGVDWGRQRDANALAVVGRLPAHHPLAAERPVGPLFVPWVEERFRTPYHEFIDHVVEVGTGGFVFESVFAETNGVGAMPTEVLRKQLVEAGSSAKVVGVHTDNRSKEDGFGAMKLLLQRGDLVLPQHAGLLRQLSALEYETLESGSLRIAVPERAGHDDLAMALMLALGHEVEAAAAWSPAGQAWRYRIGGGPARLVSTASGSPAGEMRVAMAARYRELGQVGMAERLESIVPVQRVSRRSR